MAFKPGDIVLKRYTNAKLLKNKVVLVLHEDLNESYDKYRVITPSRNQSTLSQYRLVSFEDQERNLTVELASLQRRVESQIQKLHNIRKEKAQASKLFPQI